MNIGEKIKKMRQEKGVTQEELAKACVISRSTISSWETGRSHPDLEMIVFICDYFDVTLDYLLREDQELVKEINYNFKEKKKAKKVIMLLSVSVLVLLLIGIVSWQNRIVTLSPKDINIQKIEKKVIPKRSIDGHQIQEDYEYYIHATLTRWFVTWDVVTESGNTYGDKDNVYVSFQGRTSLNILKNRKNNQKDMVLRIPSFSAQAEVNGNSHSYNKDKTIYIIGEDEADRMELVSQEENH